MTFCYELTKHFFVMDCFLRFTTGAKLVHGRQAWFGQNYFTVARAPTGACSMYYCAPLSNAIDHDWSAISHIGTKSTLE